jgi:group I intron endonuclease
MIIYKVTSSTSGKSYIGQTTKSLQERKQTHIKNIKKGIKTHFYLAILKYGEDDFNWEILDTTTNKLQLNNLEVYYIKKYNSYGCGYNMTLGGEGGDTISMKSNELKQNQGAKIGNIPWNLGLNMKELGYNFTNRKSREKFTEEQKLQHSILIKSSEKYKSGIKNRKPAKQITIEDEFGNIWNTQKQFRKDFNLTQYTTKKILNGMKYNNVSYFTNCTKQKMG